MKITCLLLFFSIVNLVASPGYAQNARISLSLKNARIEDVLNKIEDESEFYFFFNQKLIDVSKRIDIEAENKPINDVLASIFDSNVEWTVRDQQIILAPGKRSEFSLSEQQLQISGKVVDENGAALPGVNIRVEGTTTGTITDMDGKYSIGVPGKESILVFSFIGYKEIKVPLEGKSTIDVSLAPEVESLEEVVVVGYGVVKKRDITGSITSVKSEDLKNLTVTDAAHALQGKAAGVQIVNSTGAPGSTASIQIRGYSSNSKTNPLIIVDGLKVPNMNYLDPENIESLEILKDGASAAIYGIEAGNGVILITTKNGGGKGKVFYNFQHSSMNAANMPKMLNAQQYMDWQVLSGACEPEDFQYDGVTDTYWADYMFETGILERHTLGFQGGNDRGNLYISLNSIKNDGIITGNKDSYNRITGQINGDYKMKNWLTVGVTTSIEKNSTTGVTEGSSTGGSTLGSILLYDPITPWSYPIGEEPDRVKAWLSSGRNLPRDPATGEVYGTSVFALNSGIWHPATMRDRRDNNTDSFNIMGTAFLNLTPLKGLTYTSRLGYRAGYSQNSQYNYEMYINSMANQKMSINGQSSNNLYYQWENFANYAFNVGKNNFTSMLGMSYQSSTNDYVYGSANSLPTQDPQYRYLENAINTTSMSVRGVPNENTNMSYYGRLGWSYLNRYNLQVSFRADAYDTSKLDDDHRWGYFPSISGGWTVSSEKFMQDIKDKIGLSFMKFRGSYGILGNVNALGNYQYNTILQAGVNRGYDWGSGQIVGSELSTRLPNPSIKWETTRQLNFGVDARFLKDRLDLTIDWYNKNTNDLLTSTAASATTGAATVYVNAGKVNNKGLEFMLGWRDEIKDFTYSINANFATLHNEVTEGTSKDRVPGASVFQSYPVTYFEAGYPLWYLRTFILDHIDAETGKAVYKDVDNNGVINAMDQDYAGSAIPTHTYGLTVNLGYKNFDLTVNGSGLGGSKKLYSLNRGDFPQQNTLLEFYENMWTPENHNAKYPKPDYTDTYYRASSAMIFNASFFKIKQIQLGYNIPKKMLDRIQIASLRAYVSLDDWFTITKYPGLDPETNSVGTAPTTQSLGIDAANYPIARKLVFGVNVSF